MECRSLFKGCRHGTTAEMRLPRSEQYPLRSTLPIIDCNRPSNITC
jgi:hypothetical protein